MLQQGLIDVAIETSTNFITAFTWINEANRHPGCHFGRVELSIPIRSIF